MKRFIKPAAWTVLGALLGATAVVVTWVYGTREAKR